MRQRFLPVAFALLTFFAVKSRSYRFFRSVCYWQHPSCEILDSHGCQPYAAGLEGRVTFSSKQQSSVAITIVFTFFPFVVAAKLDDVVVRGWVHRLRK